MKKSFLALGTAGEVVSRGEEADGRGGSSGNKTRGHHECKEIRAAKESRKRYQGLSGGGRRLGVKSHNKNRPRKSEVLMKYLRTTTKIVG